MRIGVDPGIFGAIAIMDDNLQPKIVFDMPIMFSTGKKHQVNAAELAKELKAWSDNTTTAYLEYVSAMPGQGVTAMFNFGVSYGVIKGVLATLQIPVVIVTPPKWKKRAGLIGQEKDAARTLAQQFYPSVSLGKKKDIGKADALLIARFGKD